MPKYTKTFPSGVTRVYYETKRTVPAYETEGRVRQTAYNNRVYYKPSLRKPVIRAKNVVRTSADVLAINKILEDLAGTEKHPSYICGGLPWKERIKCLRKEMKKVITPEAKEAKLKEILGTK